MSTAQSIFGKLDPHLVFVGVDGALLGTAATGLWYAQLSRVPWCVAAVDVGFAPLLAQLADQCWKAIAPRARRADTSPTHRGDAAVATWIFL